MNRLRSVWDKKYCLRCGCYGATRHGHSRAGKQRWRCSSCRRTFVVSYAAVKAARQRVWFERWIIEGYSVRQLAVQSGYSQKSLRRLIHYWRDRPPASTEDLGGFKYVVIDGSYLHKRRTAVVGLADPVRHSLVRGFFGLKEGEARMAAVCRQLRRQGLTPISVTLDGLKQVQSMVTMIWPETIIQRCLVHIQRQGLAWCRRDPRRAATIHLRELFTRVTTLQTRTERDRFLADWHRWEERHGQAIAARPGRGPVFSDVKKARSLLENALPYMFQYLDNPLVPPSTNWLEGYFSRLKSRYRQHRGLSPTHRAAYFAWYFHLCKK